MKPAPFIYHNPLTPEDAVSLLASNEEAKILAGGQSLMPMLNMRFVVPDHVIDLNNVTGIDGVTNRDNLLEIGAMTRQCDLMANDLVKSKAPIIPEALEHVGHFQTRNRGTIGGSLCHLDPAAELPCLMAAYDANLTVQGPEGQREIPFIEWPLAYMIPNLAPDELLTKISFRYWSLNHGFGFEEFARRHGDFAIVAVAALLEVDDGKITRAAISIGGANISPVRLVKAEEALIGMLANEDTYKVAADIAQEIESISDAYVTSQYRQRLAGTLVQRALVKAGDRVNRS
ncbi:MAG: FAD binding domain-containing protein [Alphaproteobacteria bacterium]|tara:strand:- start:801 stop:1664 length:864 start_codon:yes stop_codon:yes gene_type:complete